MPITKDVLEKIVANEPINIDKLNIDMAFKVAWAGFFRLREITYIDSKLKKVSFLLTKVTRSDILFAKSNQYIVFRLKQSKINSKHTRVQIILVAMGKKTYLVATSTRLYILDPQPANIISFCLFSRAFSRFSVVSAHIKQIASTSLA